jgi:hypothetical protein
VEVTPIGRPVRRIQIRDAPFATTVETRRLHPAAPIPFLLPANWHRSSADGRKC